MIPVFDLPTSYSLEILQRLAKKGTTSSPQFDYLAVVQKGDILEEHREELHFWIFNMCERLRTSLYTKELACLLADVFLKSKKCVKGALQLVGISSIQIAVKMNESYVLDISTLSQMGEGMYSQSNLIKFEEIMLSTLNWSPCLPTSFEILSHLAELFDEICVESSSCSCRNEEILFNLSEMFKSDDFAQKIAIFIQVAIVDYNLSRFGPTITSLVAVMCYLKKKRCFAEYYMFTHVVMKIFQNEVSPQILFDSWKLAMNLVNLPISIAEENKFKDILNISSRREEDSIQNRIDQSSMNVNCRKSNQEAEVTCISMNASQSCQKLCSIQDEPNLNNGDLLIEITPNPKNKGF